MSKQDRKIIGVLFLVAGVALLAWGFDVYGAFGSKLSRAVSGDMPDKALGLFIGGGICSAFGLSKLLGK